ncbi:MAG: GNAT family N-acetyltransferase [Acidimicrobiales bacterium]
MGLTTGWEPDLADDDSLLRRFVYSFADRGRFLATSLGGRHQRSDVADFSDPDPAFVFDNAVTLLQPPAGDAVAAVIEEANRFWPIRLFVGYEEDRAVAVSGAGIAHGLVDVEWVAVLPDSRGKGYGRAMTVHAMQAQPDLPAVLLASDDGRGVYERLGFVSVLRCTIWWRPTLSP